MTTVRQSYSRKCGISLGTSGEASRSLQIGPLSEYICPQLILQVIKQEEAIKSPRKKKKKVKAACIGGTRAREDFHDCRTVRLELELQSLS